MKATQPLPGTGPRRFRILAAGKLFFVFSCTSGLFAGPLRVSAALAPEQSTIFLQAGGSLNGQPVNPTNPVVTVAAGGPIIGNVLVQTTVDPSYVDDVVPLGSTATWVDRTVQPVLSVSSIGVGVNNYTLPIDITAPDTPGTYYLPIAFSYEITIEQVMSATWWNYPGNPIWYDGNDIGWDWSPAQFQHALQYGWEQQEVLGTIEQDAVGQNGNYTILNQPATWVQIQVVPAKAATNLVESLGIHLILTSQGAASRYRNEVFENADVVRFETADLINVLGAATTNRFSDAARLLRVTPIVDGTYGFTSTVVKDAAKVVDVSGFFVFSTNGSVVTRSSTLGGHTVDARYFRIRTLALQDQLLYPALGAHFQVQGFDTSTLQRVVLRGGLIVHGENAVWTVNGTGDQDSRPTVIQGVITVDFDEVNVTGGI